MQYTSTLPYQASSVQWTFPTFCEGTLDMVGAREKKNDVREVVRYLTGGPREVRWASRDAARFRGHLREHHTLPARLPSPRSPLLSLLSLVLSSPYDMDLLPFSISPTLTSSFPPPQLLLPMATPVNIFSFLPHHTLCK